MTHADRPDTLHAAYRDLAAHIADRLRFGQLDNMPPRLRARLDQEVRDAIGQWRAAKQRTPSLAPKSDLQRHLERYCALEDESRSGGAGKAPH